MSTTVHISDETWKELSARRNRGETYEDVIKKLLLKKLSIKKKINKR